MSHKIIVDINGSGDFTSVSEAIDGIDSSSGAVIYIKNGIYKEKLIIDKPNVILIGEDRLKTVLTYGDGAHTPDESGEPMGTFKTASLHITRSAVGFEAYNLTIENSAGLGSVAGQAVALYLDCDRAVISGCRLIGKQDTLLTGPIFSDIEKEPDILNRQYFKDCYIEGDVDFIFGGACAIFEGCEVMALERPNALRCYITAACTSKALKYGYVFKNCSIRGNGSDGNVYLGRPWREYANVVYIGCQFDRRVSKKGFYRWNDTDRHLTSTYALYKCEGEGYDKSELEPWCRVLTADEAAEYDTEKVFGDWKCTVRDYKDLI